MPDNPYQNNTTRNYAINAINTASPEQLTLMLYDGAIKFCNKAIIAIERGDNEEAHNCIKRVELIIEEFQASLKMNYQIANDFAVMYDYMYRRLIEANVAKDVEIIRQVLGYFREFRDAWKEIIKNKGNN